MQISNWKTMLATPSIYFVGFSYAPGKETELQDRGEGGGGLPRRGASAWYRNTKPATKTGFEENPTYDGFQASVQWFKETFFGASESVIRLTIAIN